MPCDPRLENIFEIPLRANVLFTPEPDAARRINPTLLGWAGLIIGVRSHRTMALQANEGYWRGQELQAR